MLGELALVGGVVVAVVGLFEVSERLRRPPARPSTVSAIREAMRGPEAGAVRAEYRRSGVCPPDGHRPTTFV